MKNRGITLTELIIAVIISGFVILAITVQFVAQQNFIANINDQLSADNEAAIAVRTLTRVLRFAMPASYNRTGVAGARILTINIEGGPLGNLNYHLPEFTAAATQVIFERVVGGAGNNTFTYTRGGVTLVVARNITAFDVTPTDGTNRELTLNITASIVRPGYTRNCALQTVIRLLVG